MNVVLVVCMLAAVAAAYPGRGWYGRRMSYHNDRYYDDQDDHDSYRWPMRRQHRDRHDDDHHDDDHHDDDDDEDHHVYRFHISEEEEGAYQYHGEDGHSEGFSMDLMHAVCEHAHKECYAVMDKGTNCWYWEDAHEYPGIGLMAGWYDGCLNYFPTVERMNSFTFSHPFTTNMKVALYYRPGAHLMDPEHDHELANHTIGFVEGWAADPTCLDHQADFHGNHIGEYTIVHYEDYAHMVDAVLHDKVDAVLAPRALDLDKKGLTHTEPYFSCTTDGAGLMARYGDHTLDWWNKAFDEMVESGEFRQLCRSGERKHGAHGDIHCV